MKKLSYILLDLDNTLYPASSGVARELSRLINQYTSRYLGISEEEALLSRRGHFARYGTTLQWLRQVHGFEDNEDFFDKVHPRDLGAYLSKDGSVKHAIEKIPLPMAIFTNAPEEHARRVTDFYGVTSRFTRFFDIRYHRLQGKPHPDSYQRVLSDLGISPGETLLVDDQPLYLEGFRALGGETLLMAEAEPAVTAQTTGQTPGFPSIRLITDLPGYLERTYQC